jgi:probable HAF family extracellular repeat protein
LLTSARVMISDNGHIVAASLVTGRSPQGLLEYDLFRWQQDEAGQWERTVRFDKAVHLGDVNDQGMIVGRVLHEGQPRAFVDDPLEGPGLLPLPSGRASSYATDVNRHGQVVGVSEDPPGPEGTMSAFLWYQGQWTDLPFGIEVAASTANAITDEGRIGGLMVRAAADAETSASEAPAVESFVLQIETPGP